MALQAADSLKVAAPPVDSLVEPTRGGGDFLQLACRFFDSGCAGYIDGEDLEDIFYMVSDSISSAWTHALCFMCCRTVMLRSDGVYVNVII